MRDPRQRRSALAAVLALGIGACGSGDQAAQQAEPQGDLVEAAAELGSLGTVEFPTSASEEAQQHFLRGLAALHSFWYPVAREEFQAATRIAPAFAMGYWGEALTHDHPIWGDPQDTAAGREAIARALEIEGLTERERAYIDAARILFGTGDEADRDREYSQALSELHRRYPQDDEAALFYALSLMGLLPPQNDPGNVRNRMRAGAIALDVYARKPDHPGAAHYILHAFDDPDHAVLALPAARRYARIAPDAPHALHMPSHIFLQLGMWPDAVASNEESWAASQRWVEARNLPTAELDFHSLHWLAYASLQQGRYERAEELLNTMRRSLEAMARAEPRDQVFAAFTHASMAAELVIESRRWSEAERLLEPAALPALSGTAGSQKNPARAYAVLARIPLVFARGMADAKQGLPQAERHAAELDRIREQHGDVEEPLVAGIVRGTQIQALAIRAVARASDGAWDRALELAAQAAAIAARMPPPSGPPRLVKPAHELFGELLLDAQQPQEAARQFAISLRRHDDRALSLLGAARAARASGDEQRAGALYARLAEQWANADAGLAALREASVNARPALRLAGE